MQIQQVLMFPAFVAEKDGKEFDLYAPVIKTTDGRIFEPYLANGGVAGWKETSANFYDKYFKKG